MKITIKSTNEVKETKTKEVKEYFGKPLGIIEPIESSKTNKVKKEYFAAPLGIKKIK
jgi:hypothetical protein